jgi:hypothetical protein
MMTPVRASQAKLVASHIRAIQLDVQLNSPPEGVAWQLFRQAFALLQETADILAELVIERDSLASVPKAPGEELPPNSAAWFTVVDEPTSSRDPAGDMAFIAAAHLRRRQNELNSCTAATPADALIGRASTCVRNVLRAVCAVEPVLANAYGLPPRLATNPLLEASLLVRRAYTAFRIAISDHAAQGAPGLQGALGALRDLAHSPIRQHFRWCDRTEMAALQRRLEALTGETHQLDDLRLSTIERALGDAAAFAGVLASVSRRPELVEHDLRVLPTIIDQLVASAGSGKPVLFGHLERIRGIDDALERFLVGTRVPDPSYLLVELRRVLTERKRFSGTYS